jgi:predicted RNA binding protein YcfA (HicA-like mRNA interferase family)
MFSGTQQVVLFRSSNLFLPCRFSQVANPRRALAAVLSGSGNINFRDLETLLVRLGFRLVRVSGSHHIYVHQRATRPLNLQPMGKEAKPYQVRQLRAIIEEFQLGLDD